MKIEFNTENAAELATVAALIAGLQSESTTIIGKVAVAVERDEVAALAAEAATEATEEAHSAAEAFASPVDAGNAQPTGPAAVVPPNPPTTPTPAPAAPTAPAASPSNGEFDITANLVPSTGPTEGALMNASGVEVDKAGLPWDARIHTKKPKMKKDGFWTFGRGVDKNLIRDVCAELKQVMIAGGNAPAIDAAPLPPAVAATPAGAAEPAATVPAAAAAGSAIPEPPASVPQPPATEGAAVPTFEPVTNFATLMKKITGMQTASLITTAQVNEIAVSLGLTGLKDVMKAPELIPAFDQLLPAVA